MSVFLRSNRFNGRRISSQSSESADATSMLNFLRSNITWRKFVLPMIFLYACGILILYLCISQLLSPIESAPLKDEIIQIRPGMSAMEIGSLLAEKGIVKSSLVFQIISLINGSSHSLKAGDYLLNGSMTIQQILQKIVSGDSILYKFTIPEGFTISEVASLWEERGFGKATNFISALNGPELRVKYNIESSSLEGYLFPDTYMFPRGMTEHEAIDKMLCQFKKRMTEVLSQKPEGTNFSIHEIISLASIIEKEAKVEEERPMISAVFHNRLKSGQKLESCATVLYSLGYPNRKLTFDDLRDSNSQYNTYIYNGLPPGPICNPGLKSIFAALNPSNDKYMYFISKNDGSHYFTDNYSDFLIAKKKYQGS